LHPVAVATIETLTSFVPGPRPEIRTTRHRRASIIAHRQKMWPATALSLSAQNHGLINSSIQTAPAAKGWSAARKNNGFDMEKKLDKR
jgi:hypothetical protein